ncbi:hypothetical protein BC943DRAFT_103083 [Umbelopsis sp. AD052]|nr:hypothetical protein BC943DRAFT_103083 [Umbelopsis sp. AD052]
MPSTNYLLIFRKAKTAGRTIITGKGSDFSLDALLSTIGRSPEQKRSPPESPPKSPPPSTSSTKSPEATGSDSAGTKRKRGVTFAPDDRIAEYRYYTPNAEEWQDQPTGEAINHVHGNARDFDVGEGRMAFERTHPAQGPEATKDWHIPSLIRLPDHLVLALPEETAESKAQAIREESTFAAVYTSLTHIPPSPAEPNEAPPVHPDANVVHIPLEDLYSYQVNAERAKPLPEPSLPADPALMNNLLAAAGSVLQSMNGVSHSQIPVQAAVPPPPTNANGSVDLSLVDGLLKNPSLVQSLLGLMGTAPNKPSSPAIASPPMNTLPAGQPTSITSATAWQQSHAAPPPPPSQQPPRQPYNYYQPSPPQQYQSPNRNQQYGNNQPYPDQPYSVPGQPTPTARGQYSASGPVLSGPSQRPAINPNFRGGFRGGARGIPRGGRGKGPRGGRGNKFRGAPNRF